MPPDELKKREVFKIGFCVQQDDESFWLTSEQILRSRIDNEKELFISMEPEGFITISIGYRKSRKDYTDYIL